MSPSHASDDSDLEALSALHEEQLKQLQESFKGNIDTMRQENEELQQTVSAAKASVAFLEAEKAESMAEHKKFEAEKVCPEYPVSHTHFRVMFRLVCKVNST